MRLGVTKLMPDAAAPSQQNAAISFAGTVARAMRPAQWLKNGIVFAGLVFGGKLLEPTAAASATIAALAFCLLSSGFYLLNDVRDREADRLHPVKRLRPVPAGELSPRTAAFVAAILLIVAIVASALLSRGLFLVFLAYSSLMAAYNLGLKEIVIVDVFAIAAGFILRAVGGAIAVDVSISPWLLMCTMLLALLIGFGKRRYELAALDNAAGHRRNLSLYNRTLLDEAVAVTAAGTLIAYAVYTFDSESAQYHHPMMLTVPIVAYGVFRYLYLLYLGGQGGAPETMLLTDRPLLVSVAAWAAASAFLFYIAG
jgi:4-hydroxybenzoate polyprenyltransferase